MLSPTRLVRTFDFREQGNPHFQRLSIEVKPLPTKLIPYLSMLFIGTKPFEVIRIFNKAEMVDEAFRTLTSQDCGEFLLTNEKVRYFCSPEKGVTMRLPLN